MSSYTEVRGFAFGMSDKLTAVSPSATFALFKQGWVVDTVRVLLFFGTDFERYFGKLGNIVGTAPGSKTGMFLSMSTSSPFTLCSK